MVSIKQEVPSWDESSSLDAHLDWENDFSFTLMELPTSEFLTIAEEIEQTCAGISPGTSWTEQLISPKLQIRNHDCMWSGTCFDQSHPGKFGCGANHGNSAASNASESNKKVSSAVTAIATANLNSNAVAIQKPILAPANSSALNISSNIAPKIAPFKAQAAQIPAGRSLLINSRNKQQQQQQQQVNRVPTISTADFLREREGGVPSLHTRPDTPLSLDDDPPEFKHTIDLATCTIGSNRLSLTGHSRHHHHQSQEDQSSYRIINMLKEQLEDTESGSMRPYMTNSSGEIGSLTDLLQDLEEIECDESPGEDLDSDTDSNADGSSSSGSSSSASSNCGRSSSSKGGSGGGGGTSGGYTHAHHQEMSPTSSSSSSYEYQGTHVGDHSYTRPKNRYNLTEQLGVQTPSDSEEEIDVVSIGEKNLPTNPTARDRRALQSRVAHKIARKQAQNSGSQHRRRHSDDEYTSGHHYHGTAGGSQVSPSKTYSPTYLTPASSTSISGANTPLPGGTGSGLAGAHSNHSGSSIPNSRKRPSKDDHRNGKNRHHGHRNKKQRIPGRKPVSDSSEEQETLEKRHLHNDMERQRRIGLKNLFEELKRQIPTLRDKERAPKVNILREAATLCTRLNREQEQLNALRKQQQRLYARVRQLRTSLHTQRRVMD